MNKSEIYLSSLSFKLLLILHLATVFIHPSYSFLLDFIDPNGSHEPLQRLLVVSFSIIGLLMHVFNLGSLKVRHYFLTIGVSSIMIHLYHLCQLNNLSPIYSIGTLLAQCLILFSIQIPSLWRAYSVISIIGVFSLFRFNQEYITDLQMFASTIIVTTFLVDRLKISIFNDSLELLFTNSVQKITNQILQLAIKSKDLNKTLETSISKLQELPFINSKYPINMSINTTDADEISFIKVINNPLSIEPKPKNLINLKLNYGTQNYGSISFVVNQLGLSEDNNQSLFSLISDSISLMIKTGLDDMKVTQKNLLLTQSAKMIALGEMASGIAHEINNPLTIISGSSKNLRGYLKKEEINKEKLISLSEKIENTVVRIAKIIKGLRSFAREEKNDEKTSESIFEIIDETIGFSLERYRKNGIKLMLPKKLKSEDILLNCKKVQISQCILNLLNNSFDAVHYSNIEDPFVELKVEVKDDIIKIIVIDNGPGVLNEVKKNLFEPFFTTKPAGIGTGLGLSLCKKIIQDHQGKLYLNESSKFTEFVIELPTNA